MAKNNIEQEVRFFYPTEEITSIHKLVSDTNAEFSGRYYELTVMYDNPNEKLSFYPLEIDGRLRFRTSIYSPLDEQKDFVLTGDNSSKITWKRRLSKAEGSNVHQEEEIEVSVNYKDYKNMEDIFENILKCKRMSSYERYRSTYKTSELSITVDEFPYGIMLEVEIDSGDEGDLVIFVNKVGLSMDDVYELSCDDKYVDLCKEAKIEVKDDILFDDKNMPQIV